MLLLGESGTGKEVLARALHNLSDRRERDFVAINCAAIPDTLLESELFGHERGAFTGASKQTKGKLEFANDGITNFLPNPNNRWTSYESKSLTDWLEIDFGKETDFRRVELAIYDDRGGVQAPTSYVIEHWTGSGWQPVSNAKSSPETPTGGVINTVRFDRATTSKVRAVFTHKGNSRSGLTEIEVTSYVSPKWVPQLGDCAELCDLLAKAPASRSGPMLSALVPNEKGLAGALEANARAGFMLLRKVSVFTAASESFAKRNTNATVAETIERFHPVVRSAHASGASVSNSRTTATPTHARSASGCDTSACCSAT